VELAEYFSALKHNTQCSKSWGWGVQLHPPAKKIEQNWLDLGKFGWIWTKYAQDKAKFRQN